MERFRELLDSSAGFAGAAIVDRGRYFGVALGPGSGEGQWRMLGEKAVVRAREITAAGAGWPTQMALFNLHVGGMFLFKGRSVAPDRHASSAFRRSGKMVFSAPWMAMPLVLLSGPTAFGLPTDLSDIEALRRAARFSTSQVGHGQVGHGLPQVASWRDCGRRLRNATDS